MEIVITMIEEEKAVQVEQVPGTADPLFEDIQVHIAAHLGPLLSAQDYYSKEDRVVLTHLPKVTKPSY